MIAAYTLSLVFLIVCLQIIKKYFSGLGVNIGGKHIKKFFKGLRKLVSSFL